LEKYLSGKFSMYAERKTSVPMPWLIRELTPLADRVLPGAA
jgi:hypothetical protein